MMNKILSIFRWQSMIKPNEIVGEVPSNRNIYKKTFDIAWPSALESVLIALISSVDMMMVGYLGKEAINAVGITTQPKFIVLAPIFALNIGVTVLVSRRKGEQRQEEANAYLRNAFIISITASFILSSLAFIFAKPFLLFAGANNDYLNTGIAYFRIIMVGNFFYSTSLTITAAQRGAGNTKISMITNLTANGVNLIFNALLIHGLFFFPRLEVVGAAIATAMGNIAAFLLALYSVSHKDRYLYLKFNKTLRLQINYVKDIFKISASSFTEQIFLRIGFFIYARSVAVLGTVAFATHQLCMNIMQISFALGDGLQIANTSLVGQSLGAKRPDMAKIHSKVTQKIGIMVAMILAALIIIFNRELLGLFTTDQMLIDAGKIPLWIMAATVLFQVPQVIIVGALRGAGDVKFVAVLMLISVTLVRPIMAWILINPLGLGLVGAWIALFMDQITRNAISTWRFKQDRWSKIIV